MDQTVKSHLVRVCSSEGYLRSCGYLETNTKETVNVNIFNRKWRGNNQSNTQKSLHASQTEVVLTIAQH